MQNGKKELAAAMLALHPRDGGLRNDAKEPVGVVPHETYQIGRARIERLIFQRTGHLPCAAELG